MLLATVENMEKCKDIPGVVALDIEKGYDEYSANPGDYFAYKPTTNITVGGSKRRKLVLAVRVCRWVDPLTGKDIAAQIPAEEN